MLLPLYVLCSRDFVRFLESLVENLLVCVVCCLRHVAAQHTPEEQNG